MDIMVIGNHLSGKEGELTFRIIGNRLNIVNADEIIKQEHALRNANPLSHSSAGLLDDDGTSQNLEKTKMKFRFIY